MTREGILRAATRAQPSEHDARLAGGVAELIGQESAEAAFISFADGRRVALPSVLVDLIGASAKELANGRAVTVLPADVMLTPAETAELLGLSRPYVVRLLDGGDIASERLPRSSHRRVRLADVLSFVDQRERRRTGRRSIGEAVADADLPY